MNVPDAPYVLELPNVLHLASDVTAVAHAGVSALRLAGRAAPVRGGLRDADRRPPGRRSPNWSTWTAAATPARSAGWTPPATASSRSRCAAARSTPTDPRRITIYAGCGIVGRVGPGRGVRRDRGEADSDAGGPRLAGRGEPLRAAPPQPGSVGLQQAADVVGAERRRQGRPSPTTWSNRSRLRSCSATTFSSMVSAADEPVDVDGLVLADAVGAVDGLESRRPGSTTGRG